MAIHPKYIQMGASNPFEALMSGITPGGRITSPYIDPVFVQTMLDNFETLKSQGLNLACIHF